MTYFSEKDIKDGLVDAARLTIRACHADFHRLLNKQHQGLEKIFDDTFCNKLDKFPGWKVSRKPRRAVENPYGSRPVGWIDAIAKHKDSEERVGLEFKVCDFPRIKNNSPSGGTYHVGQIAWDYGALREYDVDFAYCIVVLFGGLVESRGMTELNLMRWFHNAMYADFQASLKWGDYNKKIINKAKKKTNKWYEEDRDFQIKTIRKMGFSKPFYRQEMNRFNFCQIYQKQRLAVIGLQVK